MIEFANEHIRGEFHSLSADIQGEYEKIAAQFARTGQVITILCIDRWGEGDRQLEVAIRIDKKFDPIGPIERD